MHKKPAFASAREIVRGNLIAARARAGFTQLQLADMAEVTRQTISELERGVANISIDVLDRIAQALGISVQGFFGAEPSVNSIVDSTEVKRRRATPRSEFISARVLQAAIIEAREAPIDGDRRPRSKLRS